MQPLQIATGSGILKWLHLDHKVQITNNTQEQEGQTCNLILLKTSKKYDK